MISLKRIAVPVLIFYVVLEFMTESHAFGKKEAPVVKVTRAAEPVKSEPAKVVAPAVKTEAIKPAAAPSPVKLDKPKKVTPKPVIVQHSAKPRAGKVVAKNKSKLPSEEQRNVMTSEVDEVDSVHQNTTPLDNVSGFFGKLKESISKPSLERACSQVARALGQC